MLFSFVRPDSSLKWTFGTALITGILLAAYTSCTVFLPFKHSSWLIFHNTLVIVSIIGAFGVGHKYRGGSKPFKLFILALLLYYTVILVLYIGTYTITTSLFANRMKWIPFFFRDYEYQAFRSVEDYLNHSNNFKDLLVLQIFSFVLTFIFYLVAGLIGFFIQFPRIGKPKVE